MPGRTTAGGWGAQHQRLRRQWARLVATGTVACARCGDLIAPSARWHLDHADDRNSYLGPSHAKCNVQAAGWKTGRRMASYPKDDPENNSLSAGGGGGWKTAEGLHITDPVSNIYSFYSAATITTQCVFYGAISMRQAGVTSSFYTSSGTVYGFALSAAGEPVCN
jgi:hypothetical protein